MNTISIMKSMILIMAIACSLELFADEWLHFGATAQSQSTIDTSLMRVDYDESKPLIEIGMSDKQVCAIMGREFSTFNDGDHLYHTEYKYFVWKKERPTWCDCDVDVRRTRYVRIYYVWKTDTWRVYKVEGDPEAYKAYLDDNRKN